MQGNLFLIFIAFALIRGSSGAAIGLTNTELTFTNQALGVETGLSIKFESDQKLDDTDTLTVVLPRFVLASSGTATTLNCGVINFNSWSASNTGAANAEIVFTAAYTSGTSEIAAGSGPICEIVVSTGVTNPSATQYSMDADNTGFTILYSDNVGSDTHSATAIITTDSIGVPQLYFRRSECKTGGIASGSREVCDETANNPCKTCTSPEGFVESTGLQKYSTSCSAAADIDEQRCDVMYFTYDSMDLHVNTNGNFGALTCAAYLVAYSGPPTKNLYQLTDSQQALTRINIDKADRYRTQTVTLNSLTSDEQYELYCHMDNVIMSPVLLAWTAPNDRIWGDSVVPSVITAANDPVDITLTFTHGTALAVGDDIILEIFSSTSTTIFSGDASCSCTVYSNGNEIAVSIDDSSTNTLTIKLNGASAKGNQIVATCVDNLAINPANNVVISYTLTVDNHPQILNSRYGWKSLS